MSNRPSVDHNSVHKSIKKDVGEVVFSSQCNFMCRYFLFVGLSLVNASVPFYGYWVHATRDYQITAYVLFFCWIINWLIVVGVGAWLVWLLSSEQFKKLAVFAVFELILVVAGLLADDGVERAIGELLIG